MLTTDFRGMLIPVTSERIRPAGMEFFLAIFLIFLGVVILLLGLRNDLASCRGDADRLRLGWFLIGLTGLSILVYLGNQWLPSVLAWAIWLAFFIGIVLMVRWIQGARTPDETQSNT